MSKAEDKAKNRYPTLAEECAFIDGYEEAEKDLELTWKDIREIFCTTLNLREHLGASVFGEPLYQEVLKRFKERKQQ